MTRKFLIGVMLVTDLMVGGCAGYSGNYRYNPYGYYHYPYGDHDNPYGHHGYGYGHHGGWQHY